MHSSNKTKLGAYHLRQGLGIVALVVGWWIVMMVFFAIVPWSLWRVFSIVSSIGYLGILAFIVMGIIAAAAEEEKPLPIVGKFFNTMFKTLFV